jgi:tetratricopeptide (TPR) repeat protein
MLGLYTAFCHRRLRALPATARADRANWGFRLMELDLALRPRAAGSHVLFLPTAESAILRGRLLTLANRLPEARKEFERVMALAPGVAHFTTHYAEVFAKMGKWERAYRLLSPFARLGHVDNYNLPTLGVAAVWTGRYDEAIAVLERCVDLYDAANPNRVNLAWAWREKAGAAVASGRLAEAGRDIEAADRVTAAIPPDPTGFYEVQRRQIIAEILGTRADLVRALGREPGMLRRR